MKISKIISVIAVVIMLLTSMQIFAFGETCTDGCNHHDHEVEVVFYDDVSEETAAKIISHFNGENAPDASTYGLTCTLFGHKLDYGTTSAITHKVNATSPRCLKETFNYEICTRCDYSKYTLLGSEYIVCC